MSSTPSDQPHAAKDATGPPKLSRRTFFRRALALGAVPLSLGAYATQVEPFWLDAHDVDVTIPNLPRAFDGFRVAHLTDMHAGDGVKMDYLEKVVRRLIEMKPDCVAVTGDLVNHTSATIEPVADLLATIRVPVFVSFGNHDYAAGTARPQAWTFLADPLEAALVKRGCVVLRNKSVAMQRGRGKGANRLWFVGLEDLYTTRFSPQAAFQGVDTSEPVVALSHNPDSATWLQNWGAKLVLSGHTHGGQIRIPLLGAPVLPLLNRRFEQGLFQMKNQCQLYVSRGVGFLYRARLCCRPQLPCIVLRSPLS